MAKGMSPPDDVLGGIPSMIVLAWSHSCLLMMRLKSFAIASIAST